MLVNKNIFFDDDTVASFVQKGSSNLQIFKSLVLYVKRYLISVCI